MEVISKQFAAIAQRWQSMTVAARLAAGLLAIVAVISVAFLAHREAPRPDTLLFGGEPIAADHLPRVEAAFAKAGLVDYEIEGGRIRVPRGRNSAFMAALAAADALPRNFGEILDRSLRQTNPFMGRAQQEELIKIARQNELAAIIQKMKGVARAAVLYDREKKAGLGGGENITASVTVQLQENRFLTTQQVLALRNLVSSSIAGLSPNKVAVIDLNSGRSLSADQMVETAVATGTDAVRTLKQPPNEKPRVTDVSAAATAEPSATTAALEWSTRHTRELGMGGLAIVSVVVVCFAVRAKPASAAADNRPTDTLAQATATSAPQPKAGNQLTADLTSPESAAPTATQDPPARLAEPALRTVRGTAPLRSELANLVRDDPHAAAQVLRAWIGSSN